MSYLLNIVIYIIFVYPSTVDPKYLKIYIYSVSFFIKKIACREEKNIIHKFYGDIVIMLTRTASIYSVKCYGKLEMCRLNMQTFSNASVLNEVLRTLIQIFTFRHRI